MPAWPEPGKELHRLDFDYAFQPIAADGLVYFASSADDTVRALDAATGAREWRFTAGGPIRFAPTIARQKAYIASDDGWIYCLDARTGGLIWRFHAAPDDDQIIGNDRLISRWPCRSGPLVVGDIVCTAIGGSPTIPTTRLRTGPERRYTSTGRRSATPSAGLSSPICC
jgi:hypothetical protein